MAGCCRIPRGSARWPTMMNASSLLRRNRAPLLGRVAYAPPRSSAEWAWLYQFAMCALAGKTDASLRQPGKSVCSSQDQARALIICDDVFLMLYSVFFCCVAPLQ